MTFFSEEPTTEKTQAGLLQVAVSRAYPSLKIHKNWRESWAGKFKLLNKTKGQERVQKVLEWYCDHLGKPGIREYHSGTAFYDNFLDIEKMMLEMEDKPVVSENIQRWCVDLLAQFPYPQEIVTALPQILQTTANRWDNFYARMETWIQTHPDSTRCICFLQHVMSWYLVLFPLYWGEYLGRKYGGLKTFTGVVLKLSWSPDRRDFKESFWDKWSREYCSNSRAFDALYGELQEEKR